jgi:formylglycine-generating enzyme required for sulfatase activity
MDDEMRTLERELRADPSNSGALTRLVTALARTKSLEPLARLDAWSKSARPFRKAVAQAIARLCKVEFVALEQFGAGELATFREPRAGLSLVLVPGGEFEMGFSKREEERLSADAREHGEDSWLEEAELPALESAHPIHRVTVPSFLIARAPLTFDQANTWTEAESEFGEDGDAGAWLQEDQVEDVLGGSGLRLPSEAEWERAARAGTQTLVPWGDRVPVEKDLVWTYAELAKAPKNAFGLVGVTSYEELCLDAWHDSYDGAPTDGSAWGDSAEVVRGGGIGHSPWQNYFECYSLLVARRRTREDAMLGVALRLALSCP